MLLLVNWLAMETDSRAKLSSLNVCIRNCCGLFWLVLAVASCDELVSLPTPFPASTVLSTCLACVESPFAGEEGVKFGVGVVFVPPGVAVEAVVDFAWAEFLGRVVSGRGREV